MANTHPYWYGIESVRFIYHGDWSDPEISHNDMVISSHIVEDTMLEQYEEYCEEHHISEADEDFKKYMKENGDEVKSLIQIAYDSIQESIENEDMPSATMDKLGVLKLRVCDIKTILSDGDISEICEQPYVLKQFKPFKTAFLTEMAEYLADEEFIFRRDEAIEKIIWLTACQLSK